MAYGKYRPNKLRSNGVPTYSNSQCKRCGSTAVAWIKNMETGKWYLAPIYLTDERYPRRKVRLGVVHDCNDPAKGGKQQEESN